MSIRLMVVGSDASPVSDQVYQELQAALAASVPTEQTLLYCADSSLKAPEVLTYPAATAAQVATTLRTTTKTATLVQGLSAVPAPSFDTLGWNLALAADSGLNVVYALDGSGMGGDLLVQEIETFLARAASHHASVAGVVLTGVRGFELECSVPLLHSPFEDSDLQQLNLGAAASLTPLGFQVDLLARAAANRKRIVLPESDDARILTATAQLVEKGVADIILVGQEDQVRARSEELGLSIEGARIVGTNDPLLAPKYAAELQRLRASKGMTLEQASELVAQPTYFATMMVQMGDADGMVSGATHTTADTIRPAFQIIKTAPGASLVSSAFLMLMQDHVLVFADCAVSIAPSADQLAQIASSSAQTARAFGIDPKVALLSYSTVGSGSGPSVDLVTEATNLVRQSDPSLPVEGPIQYDAAVDPTVGSQKAPGSPVAGQATVLVFPDLNAGNIAYKAIQRSSGAVAVGPILQGLRKPVNDLSRGALVEDIVNTVAITAVQAGGN